MKATLTIILAALLASGCGKQPATSVQAEDAASSPQTAELPPLPGLDESNALAQAAVQEFAAALKSELMGAMKAGGPASAINACNTRAMPISRKVSEKHGLELSRVSLRNRNPANAPNEWQSRVLEDFERRKAAGEDPARIAWSEIAETKNGREFRFMKAIPTAEVCLVCHGSDLSPEIREVLAAVYPHDRATGFQVGDIRGAFVVTR